MARQRPAGGGVGMRIAVHAKVLSETEPTGIGVYVVNILRALARIDHENEYVLYSNEPLRQTIDAPNFNVKILHFPRFWSYLRLPFEFVGGRYDLLFVPKEQLPPWFRPPTVLVVYDLMGLMFPDRIAFAGKAHFHIAVHYAIPRADAVIAISHATKKSIQDTCGIASERITVTHLGYDAEHFRPCTDAARVAEVRQRHGLDREYFINTSSVIWYRKNLVRVLQALARLKADHGAATPQLVITGKRGEAYEEVLHWRRTLGLESDVVLTGYVPAADMPVLLSSALALVFPSLDEGFGLPLLEAMACGCPVLSSDRSAIPEVVGDAGLLVDPEDTAALHRAMQRLLIEPELRRSLRERGRARAPQFSWDAAARATRAVFERVGAGRRRSKG
jgi:glycosyltransferase involved in cell wall biosynthesis